MIASRIVQSRKSSLDRNQPQNSLGRVNLDEYHFSVATRRVKPQIPAKLPPPPTPSPRTGEAT